MSLRVVVISASPRNYGNVSRVARFVVKLISEMNADAVHFNVYNLRIEPCIGCVSDNVLLCKFPCIFEDDGKRVLVEIDRSDGIIFITPIYWYNIPGPLKNLIDRMTVLENAIFTEGASRLDGKVAGFIVVGNDTGAIAVIQNLMAVLNSMGALIPPWALAYYEGDGDPLENESFVLDVANIVRNIIQTAKIVKSADRQLKWYLADAEFKQFVMKKAKETSEEVFNEFSAS